MRIGVYGGSFDPPHRGHLALAKSAIAGLELDELLVIPAARNPLKSGVYASAKQRLEMVRLMAAGEAKMAVSDIEIQRDGPSYSFETLMELSYARPAEYWFIVGTDALKGIREWKNPEKLIRYCRIGAALRPGFPKEIVLAHVSEDVQAKIDWFEMPPTDISSSDVRERMRRGLSVSHLVEPKILQYIDKNKLYRS
jgi:nicotinate-nucleotide adenylyltransferase